MNIILDVIDEESGLLLNPDVGTIRVDIALLRTQRDAVLREIDALDCLMGQDGTAEQVDMFNGIVNMFDAILDCAECEAAS